MPQPHDIEWDIFQSLGRMPANLDTTLNAPAKTWVAAAIDKTSRKILAQSEPQATAPAARADAETKLAAWLQKNGG